MMGALQLLPQVLQEVGQRGAAVRLSFGGQQIGKALLKIIDDRAAG